MKQYHKDNIQIAVVALAISTISVFIAYFLFSKGGC